MGNTSSHPGSPGSPSGANTSAGTPQTATLPAAPQPTSTSVPIAPGSNTSPSAHPPASALHSGLTPPPQPPSPPPPPTPPLLPYGGHLSPQNPHALSHPQAHDYSKNVVTRLVLEAKLAPFYRGLEDWEDNYTEEDIARVLSEVRAKDFEDGVEKSEREGMTVERDGGGMRGSMVKKIGIHRNRDGRKEEEKEEKERRERKAYIGATECPICFLVSSRTSSRRRALTGTPRATLPTSTPRAAASNPSAPNVSCR